MNFINKIKQYIFDLRIKSSDEEILKIYNLAKSNGVVRNKNYSISIGSEYTLGYESVSYPGQYRFFYRSNYSFVYPGKEGYSTLRKYIIWLNSIK